MIDHTYEVISMEPKQPIALQSSSNRRDEKNQRTRRHARLIFNPLDKTNQRKYPQLMIAPEEINKIEIVKPNVEATELFNGMTEEVVEAAPELILMLNLQDEKTINNTVFDIHNVLKDNIYLSDNYKTVVGNRSVRDSYISSSTSFSINDSFLNNNKNVRSTNMLVDYKDHIINSHGSDVKKKVPSGTRVMLVGDEQPNVQQPGDIAHTSHASSNYSDLFKAIMKTIVRNEGDGNNTDSHNDNPQSPPHHNHVNAVLKLGPKARKRFLILRYSLPKQHMKLTRHLKVEIIRECKKIDDLDCWSDEENHLFDLPDEDDDEVVVEEEEEEAMEMSEDDASSEGRNKILRLNGAIHNNNNFYNLINESRHMGRAQYQDGRYNTTTTTTASIFEKPSDIVQDDRDELIRKAVNILYGYKKAQLKKAESRGKSSTLQKIRVISTFILR